MSDVMSHQTARLSAGRHDSPAHGVCVMELASMLAGEPFTDRPRAVDRGLAAFLRTYNDTVDDQRRQDLYEVAASVVGTGRGWRSRRHCRSLIRREARRACGGWAYWADDPAVRLANHYAEAGCEGHRRALEFLRAATEGSTSSEPASEAAAVETSPG
jgi:hypothetical protein